MQREGLMGIIFTRKLSRYKRGIFTRRSQSRMNTQPYSRQSATRYSTYRYSACVTRDQHFKERSTAEIQDSSGWSQVYSTCREEIE